MNLTLYVSYLLFIFYVILIIQFFKARYCKLWRS